MLLTYYLESNASNHVSSISGKGWSKALNQCTMLTVTWCHSECCVPSGLDFQAAGGSIVRYCLSNYLLRGHPDAVNMHDMGTLSWLNAEPLERVPTPLVGRLLRCSALFRETTVNAEPHNCVHVHMQIVPQYHGVLLTYYLKSTVSNHVPSISRQGWTKALNQCTIQYGGCSATQC